MLAIGLLFDGSAALNAAAAAPLRAEVQKPQSWQESWQATDLSARRRNWHPARYADRPSYQPYYYDRPSDYRPYPYVAPLPFFLGFGFGPRW
jgi:hypothetical protein